MSLRNLKFMSKVVGLSGNATFLMNVIGIDKLVKCVSQQTL